MAATPSGSGSFKNVQSLMSAGPAVTRGHVNAAVVLFQRRDGHAEANRNLSIADCLLQIEPIVHRGKTSCRSDATGRERPFAQ